MNAKLGLLGIGDVLDDKYVIESIVGRGGMGVVYRARHLELNAFRAIKVMHPELAESDDFLARFRNEAKLAEELRHPHIVTLHDLSALPDGTPYIVWEYVEGETLSHAFHRGIQFRPEEAVALVGQVASGLAAAHERQIVHRDISPDNLMLTRDAQGGRTLKVLDFGMAKFVGSITEPGSGATSLGVFMGKIGYSAPEQVGVFEDIEPLDRRTDVFSLAVVAYRMLVGKLPFRTTSIQAFLFDLTTAPESDVRERFTRELEPAFREAFSHALARGREHRTPCTDELKRELEGALHGHPPAARAKRQPEPTMSFRARRRRLVLGALGATVLLAGLVMMVTARTGVAPDEARRPALSSGATESPRVEREIVLTPLTVPAPLGVDASSPSPGADGSSVLPASTPDSGAKQQASSDAVPSSPFSRPAHREPVSLTPPDRASDSGGAEPVAPPPIAYGSVSITSDTWFEVRLDDGALQETPVFLRRIPAGRHELRVSRPGEPVRSLDIVVREGETTAVRLDRELQR